MERTDDPDFFNVELADGGVAAAIELELPPYGVAEFYTDEESDEGRDILRTLWIRWADLWPRMRTQIEECAEDIDATSKLVEDTATAYVAKTKPGEFMSESAETYLSITFEDGPNWDFFLKGGEIVHFQLVF